MYLAIGHKPQIFNNLQFWERELTFTKVLFSERQAHCYKELENLVKGVEKGWCMKGNKVKEQWPELLLL